MGFQASGKFTVYTALLLPTTFFARGSVYFN